MYQKINERYAKSLQKGMEVFRIPMLSMEEGHKTHQRVAAMMTMHNDAFPANITYDPSKKVCLIYGSINATIKVVVNVIMIIHNLLKKMSVNAHVLFEVIIGPRCRPSVSSPIIIYIFPASRDVPESEKIEFDCRVRSKVIYIKQ